jgi:uncharacterized membrane protein
MVGLVSLASLGFDIPVLRQIVGFIFLTFVPGILILRILRVHNISTAESLVYSVALSLAFVMFVGLFMNTLYPLIGISKPISIYPLITTIPVIVLILCAVAYQRDRDFLSPSQPGLPPVFSPPYLFLILLLLLAVSGTLLVNYYQNNILLLIFIPMAAATVALVAFGKFIPERAYSLVIVVIAIAFLYQSTETLASPFLSGYDIQAEYLYQGLTLGTGYWSPERPTNLNTALSLVILSPIYSLVLKMGAVWVFKIIFPLFFCLVPLALFQAYREQAGSQRAFFSVFFFMSVIYFFGVGNRMMVAELFFAVLILLMVDRKLPPLPKSALAIICVMALPISYYGLTYVSLFLFVISWLLLILMKNKTAVNWWARLTARLTGSPANPGLATSAPQQPPVSSILTGNFIILFIVFALAWYWYTASGAGINTILHFGQHIASTVGEFFNPVARESLVGTATGADFVAVSNLGRSFRVFQYITQIFVIIGFIRLLFEPRGLKFRAVYVSLTMLSALILFLCIVLPYFSAHMEVERFYHFCLFLLSPLCVLGGEAIWQNLSRLFKAGSTRLKFRGWLAPPFNFGSPSPNYLRFFTLGVLIPYFLFNTGFIFEVARSELYNVVDTPSSNALSSYRLDMITCNYRENAVVEWIPDVVDKKLPIYGDRYGYLSVRFTLYQQSRMFPGDAAKIPEDAYIFLRTWNIDKNEVVVLIAHGEHIRFKHISIDDLPGLSRVIAGKNLIYNNGGAQVLGP